MSIQDRVESLSQTDREHIIDQLSGQELDADELYADLVDETEGHITIMGIDFLASDVLQNYDEIAWRCGVNDYVDSLLKDEQVIDIEGELYCPIDVERELDALGGE